MTLQPYVSQQRGLRAPEWGQMMSGRPQVEQPAHTSMDVSRPQHATVQQLRPQSCGVAVLHSLATNGKQQVLLGTTPFWGHVGCDSKASAHSNDKQTQQGHKIPGYTAKYGYCTMGKPACAASCQAAQLLRQPCINPCIPSTHTHKDPVLSTSKTSQPQRQPGAKKALGVALQLHFCANTRLLLVWLLGID